MKPADDPRLHAVYCPRSRPATGRRLDMFPDYGAFPVWSWRMLPARGGHPAREVHGGMSPRSLGISDELAAALDEWSRWQDRHQQGPDLWSIQNAPRATDEEWAEWKSRGAQLAKQLAAESGDLVVYMWPWEGCDPSCPHCGEGCTRNGPPAADDA
ncbi:hypothetical protein [Actinoplanes sp. URMC 104]|uniref:hypothetical protein n=1 Tax=Actinoplanes sp. URMC 104 TaxID=3423409 RepID=UPI003F1BF653